MCRGVSDRTVLVTGGTGGLGAAVTRAFLEDGWRVVVPWIAERELERVEEHERLELVQADLFDPAAVARAVAAAGPVAARRWSTSSAASRSTGACTRPPVETFEEQLRLNLRPAYLACSGRAAASCSSDGGGRDRVRLLARGAPAVRRAPRATSWARRRCSPSSTRSTPSTARTACASTRCCRA